MGTVAQAMNVIKLSWLPCGNVGGKGDVSKNPWAWQKWVQRP